jgi:hypothetical protein
MLNKKLKIMLGISLAFLSSVAGATPILASGSGLASPGVLLTFDEVVLATNSSVTTEYSAFGVTFDGLFYDSSCCIASWTPDGAEPYLGNVTTSTETFTSWTVLFAAQQSEVAFTMASNTATHMLSAYLNGSLVESFNINGSSWGYYGFTGIVFDELRMDANSAMLIDNFQFSNPPTSVSVSESGTMALLALGIAGLAVRRRKKVA